jgi:thiamine pyrophosphate-dependent acetolactate synthase large subunit-like protein
MPNYKPSQSGLERYRQNRKEETEQKIKEAIETLRKAKKPVNFNSVSQTAGLSTVTLYKYNELAELIRSYRDNHSVHQKIKKRVNVTVAQLEVINQGLERKVEELTEENKWLQKRIEFQNGEILELKKQLQLLKNE